MNPGNLWSTVWPGLILLALAGSAVQPLRAATRVEIKNGQFYVDNLPFYVRGVGYAPWRPHQRPGVSYVDTNRRWTAMDFERMKAAHFNTIRTWTALGPEELALAAKNGLMVLEGIRLDPKQDFSDPRNQDSCVAQVEDVARRSKEAGNILGYLVMSEPSPQAVLETGQEDTLQFFRRLKRSIQVIDPRPVSIDSWLPLAFLDQSSFDFVTVNLYPFWPASLNAALGYPGLVRWFSDHAPPDRPFLVGETGGYAVSEASVTAGGGYGGLSEYDQSLKDLQSLRATVQGHAAGSVLVSWIDTWHYPRDPDRHDNEPWEWDGILGIPTDSRRDLDGIPRQIYHDLIAHNEALILEPKTDHDYDVGQSLPIRVYAAENAAEVRYSLNGDDWVSLEGSQQGWWQGFFKLPKLARKRQHIVVEALDDKGSRLVSKDVSFLAAEKPESLSLDAGTGKKGLSFTVKVLDGRYHPIAARKITFGCFYPVSLKESQGSVTTTADGQASFVCLPSDNSQERYVFAAAGTEGADRVRVGDMKIFKLGS